MQVFVVYLHMMKEKLFDTETKIGVILRDTENNDQRRFVILTPTRNKVVIYFSRCLIQPIYKINGDKIYVHI